MHHRVEAVFRHDAVEERLVPDVALHELRLGCYGPPVPGRQIVEDDHILAHFRQRQNHVAADVAGAARHENGH